MPYKVHSNNFKFIVLNLNGQTTHLCANEYWQISIKRPRYSYSILLIFLISRYGKNGKKQLKWKL